MHRSFGLLTLLAAIAVSTAASARVTVPSSGAHEGVPSFRNASSHSDVPNAAQTPANDRSRREALHACSSPRDCAGGALDLCDEATGTCTKACSADADCAPALSRCGKEGRCVECLDDSSCVPPATCDVSLEICDAGDPDDKSGTGGGGSVSSAASTGGGQLHGLAARGGGCTCAVLGEASTPLGGLTVLALVALGAALRRRR